MKRMSMGSSKEENYEHVLMCLICRSLFDDHDHQPKFLPCHHTFCKDCLREYVRQIGEEIECPSCRKVATIPTAGVSALQTNFYVKYIHNLVQGVYIGDGSQVECGQHPGNQLKYYCRECTRSICDECCHMGEPRSCQGHKKQALTAVTEEYHQKLDSGFAKSHAIIERKKVELEAILKALAHEKDQALLKIDSVFEDYAHTLGRRTTLLKNKVIAIYNEHVEALELDLEEISTAMTCIVSLKEFYETFLAHGQFAEIDCGLIEMDEVQQNIRDKISPRENHILFEDKHGADKFKGCVKDLGRVRCSRPTIPRTEPEGNDAAMSQNSPSTSALSDSDSAISPISTSAAAANPSPMPAASAAGPQENSMPLTAAGIPPACSTGSSEEGVRPKRRDDSMTASLHAHVGQLGGDANLLRASGESALDKRAGSQTDPVPNGSTTNAAMPASGQAGSEKPVMVVRPKTLKSSNIVTRKPDKTGGTTKSAKVKPMAMVNQLINQSKQRAASRAGGNAEADPAPVMPLRPPVHPKEEILKQTDKMYHHLVYTSYDEEELLKELKAGKVQVDEGNGGGPLSSGHGRRRGMEDSDSWMTVSSDGDSTISGGSDDLASPRDVSQL